MKLITTQLKANSAAQRWKQCYFHSIAKHWQYDPAEKERIYNALIALGRHPRPEDVNQVIGNEHWTNAETCEECGKESNEVIELGDNLNDESAAFIICPSCLQKALDRLTKEK